MGTKIQIKYLWLERKTNPKRSDGETSSVINVKQKYIEPKIEIKKENKIKTLQKSVECHDGI